MVLDPRQTRRTDVLDSVRPWASGFPGELRRDPYTGNIYSSADTNRWLPVWTTDKDVILHVNPSIGDDANDGDVGSPLETIQEALDRIPPTVCHFVIIDLQDNGGIQTFDEQVFVRDFQIQAGGIKILGKTQIATLAQGSTTVTPNAGNTGTNKFLTITPSPNWLANDLVGRFFEITTGTHAGSFVSIIGNTADTLELGSVPFTFYGSYDNTDGGDILDISTIIKQASQLYVIPTMEISNIMLSEDISVDSGLVFERVHIAGDNDVRASVFMHGNVSVEFNESRIDDYMSATTGVLQMTMRDSLIWATKDNPYQAELFSSTSSFDGGVAFLFCGFIGGILVSEWGSPQVQIIQSNFKVDPITPANMPDRFIRAAGGILVLSMCSLDGEGSIIPIEIRGGSKAELRIQHGVELLNSPTSGIMTNKLSLGHAHIRIDELANGGSNPYSQIDGNAEYGIDVSGPHIIDFYKPTFGSNGIAGMRLRYGAVGKFSGAFGSEPLLYGPGGAGVDEIDFDNQVGPVFINFDDADTVGLQSLCQYIQNGQ